MKELIKSISSYGIIWTIITVIGYFWFSIRLKKSVEHEYEKKLKELDHKNNTQLAEFKLGLSQENELKLTAYKDKLKSASDIQILQLTKDLELKASERNIKLTQVFEEQAKIISGTYSRLLALLNATEDYTTLMQSNEEIKPNMQAVKIATDEFYKFYHPNKIYLPKTTTNQIEQLFRSITTLVRKHATAEIINQSDVDSPIRQGQITRLNADIDSLQEKIPALLLELEKDFHKIFGISVEERKSGT